MSAVLDLSPPSNPLADLLDRMAADARAGKIAGVGIITVSGGGQVTTSSIGPHALILLGCEIMRRDIVEAATKPSPIMRPM